MTRIDTDLKQKPDRRLRLSRRRHSARLRRSAQLPDPARAGAARTERGAYGRRLRARLGRGGRGHRDQRAGRDQPGHRHCYRYAGLDSHGLHHGQCVQQGAGHGRISGNRHHRHHAAGDEAQFSREQAGGRGAGACARRFRSRVPGVPVRCWSILQKMRSRRRRCSISKPQSRARIGRIPC